MTDHPQRHAQPAPDTLPAIGGHDDCDIRLACLIEARRQMERADAYGFGDILYRARWNARFVIEGVTPELKAVNGRTGSADTSDA